MSYTSQFKLMSGKFSNTGTGFGSFVTSNKQEQFIRQIAQDEVFQIMSDIKMQIETKIKSIDKNILEIRNDIKKILLAQKDFQITALVEKMQKIQAQMQILKYHQQISLKNSRSKSLDKERKPIFKRDHQNYDFSSVILGFDVSEPQVKSQTNITSQKKITSSKPPLPKEQTRQKVEYGRKVQLANNSLQINQSSTVERWLTENNNRQSSSCLGSIIKEQDMEQSVFY